MILRVPPMTYEAIKAWLQQMVDEPPTMSEEAARIIIVEMLWVMYTENPDSIGLPGTQPRDVWDSMLGEPHEAMVAAGVAALWP